MDARLKMVSMFKSFTYVASCSKNSQIKTSLGAALNNMDVKFEQCELL